MLRFYNNIALVNKRRTLKALYAHTQGYPYAATLDSTLTITSGGQLGVTGSFAWANPGTVMVKGSGETVKPAAVATLNTKYFGLLGHFVGGQMDELGGTTSVGVWKGNGSVFEVLAPAFVDTGLAAAAAAEDGTVANETYLKSDSTGLLTLAGAIGTDARAARLISRLSANAILVELLV